MKRLLLILALLVVGAAQLAAQSYDETVRQLQKLARAVRLTERYYLDTLRMEQLVDGALTGMLSTLDPHSAYLPKEAMEEVGAVVEGYYAAKSAWALAQKMGVEMPITEAAYKVLYEGLSAKDVTHELLMRRKKAESEDAGWL